MDNDIDYFRRRAEQERALAARADCVVRSVHEEMARLYARRAASGGSEAEHGFPAPMPASATA